MSTAVGPSGPAATRHINRVKQQKAKQMRPERQQKMWQWKLFRIASKLKHRPSFENCVASDIDTTNLGPVICQNSLHVFEFCRLLCLPFLYLSDIIAHNS
jgi:hypothetical protein